MSTIKHRLAKLEKLAPQEDTPTMHQLSTQELKARIDRLMERVPEREGFCEHSATDEEYALVIEWLQVFSPDIAGLVSKPNNQRSL